MITKNVKKSELSEADKKFIAAAHWKTQFRVLNSSGYEFEKQSLESNNDVCLFVIEKEEDNRHIKGGWFTWIGTVYGMPVDGQEAYWKKHGFV